MMDERAQLARAISELAQETRNLRQEIGSIRSDIQHVRQELKLLNGGLAMVISHAAENKKKLGGWRSLSSV